MGRTPGAVGVGDAGDRDGRGLRWPRRGDGAGVVGQDDADADQAGRGHGHEVSELSSEHV